MLMLNVDFNPHSVYCIVRTLPTHSLYVGVVESLFEHVFCLKEIIV